MYSTMLCLEVKKSRLGLDNKLNHVLKGVFIFIEGQPHIYLSLHREGKCNVCKVIHIFFKNNI